MSYSSEMEHAVHLTMGAINRRAARFRNLVVLVVAITGASAACVWLLNSWLALLGILTLVPLCGVFVALDRRLVRQWRDEVIAVCARGHLDIGLFRSAIMGIRTLPASTLEGMLDMLPPNAQSIPNAVPRHDV